MEETLKLATWNVRGALSDPLRADSVLDVISGSKADIIALPNAWHEDSEESEETDRRLLVTAGDFRRRGFTALKASFREDRPDDNYARYGLMTLIRSPIAPSYETLTLGTRPAHHLRLSLGSRAVSLISLQLSDLNDSSRLEQINDLGAYLSDFPVDAIGLYGDFNAMHSGLAGSRILNVRLVQKLLQFTPTKKYTLPRLTGMTSGTAMRRLEHEGYIDCDPAQQPTMPSDTPLFQLDHIMTRSSPAVHIEAEPPVLINYPELSDHLMVTSTLTIKKV